METTFSNLVWIHNSTRATKAVITFIFFPILQCYHRITASFSLEGTSECFFLNSVLRAGLTSRLDQGAQDQGARWALSTSKGGNSSLSLDKPPLGQRENFWGKGRTFSIFSISLVASCACCLLSFHCSLIRVRLFCLSSISFTYRRQQLDQSPFSFLFNFA